MEPEEDDPELEVSPLSGLVTKDGITVEVMIYRILGSTEGWALEVVNENDTSTAWDELFTTEQDAYAEFERVAKDEGMSEFLDQPSTQLH